MSGEQHRQASPNFGFLATRDGDGERQQSDDAAAAAATPLTIRDNTLSSSLQLYTSHEESEHHRLAEVRKAQRQNVIHAKTNLADEPPSLTSVGSQLRQRRAAGGDGGATVIRSTSLSGGGGGDSNMLLLDANDAASIRSQTTTRGVEFSARGNDRLHTFYEPGEVAMVDSQPGDDAPHIEFTAEDCRPTVVNSTHKGTDARLSANPDAQAPLMSYGRRPALRMFSSSDEDDSGDECEEHTPLLMQQQQQRTDCAPAQPKKKKKRKRFTKRAFLCLLSALCASTLVFLGLYVFELRTQDEFTLVIGACCTPLAGMTNATGGLCTEQLSPEVCTFRGGEFQGNGTTCEDGTVVCPPTPAPTPSPTVSPTASPTASPTRSPTTSPTRSPTASPTDAPTASPTPVCPTDLRQCPDGTFVKRDPESNCEFFACPDPEGACCFSNGETCVDGVGLQACADAQGTYQGIGSTCDESPCTTREPTRSPTRAPTDSPTRSPTNAPTRSPTNAPTRQPTKQPSTAPTVSPTPEPTRTAEGACCSGERCFDGVTREDCTSEGAVYLGDRTECDSSTCPTAQPTDAPSNAPSVSPTRRPTEAPSVSPTPQPTPTAEGACCLNEGETCVDGVTAQECQENQGFYGGDRSSCTQTQCPTSEPTSSPSRSPSVSPTARPTQKPTERPTPAPTVPEGACCLLGQCIDAVEQVNCQDANGVYQGDASDCDTSQCPTPPPGPAPETGACCLLGKPEECVECEGVGCTLLGGTFLGLGSDCDNVTCPTAAPTNSPSVSPTRSPTASPSRSPTRTPTTSPTTAPTAAPTALTARPTVSPTVSPTASPTQLSCELSSPNTTTGRCDAAPCIGDEEQLSCLCFCRRTFSMQTIGECRPGGPPNLRAIRLELQELFPGSGVVNETDQTTPFLVVYEYVNMAAYAVVHRSRVLLRGVDNPNDTFVLLNFFEQQISAGETVSSSDTRVLSRDLSAFDARPDVGQYEVVLQLDFDDQVDETNELDNELAVPLLITQAPLTNITVVLNEDWFDGEEGWQFTDMVDRRNAWRTYNYTTTTDQYDVWWCGVDVGEFADTLDWATLPGYGNSWLMQLDKRYAPLSSDEPDFRFTMRYDTEELYDGVKVFLTTAPSFEEADAEDVLELHRQACMFNLTGAVCNVLFSGCYGRSEDIATSNADGFVEYACPTPFSIDDVVLARFEFESDGSFSDQDGDYVSEFGAAMIDSVEFDGNIDTFDAQSEDGWVPIVLPQAEFRFRREERPTCDFRWQPGDECLQTTRYNSIDDFEPADRVYEVCGVWVAFDNETGILPPTQQQPIGSVTALLSPEIELPGSVDDGYRYIIDYGLYVLPQEYGLISLVGVLSALGSPGGFDDYDTLLAFVGESAQFVNAQVDVTDSMNQQATRIRIAVGQLDQCSGTCVRAPPDSEPTTGIQVSSVRLIALYEGDASPPPTPPGVMYPLGSFPANERFPRSCNGSEDLPPPPPQRTLREPTEQPLCNSFEEAFCDCVATDAPTTSPTTSPTRAPTTSPTPAPTTLLRACCLFFSSNEDPTCIDATEETCETLQGVSLGSGSVCPEDEMELREQCLAVLTDEPTAAPSLSPSVSPTRSPSVSPTRSPTAQPTTSPSVSPSVSPTNAPTTSPTTSPTPEPEPGACCILEFELCLDDLAPTVCAQNGGTFQGPGTTCMQVSCATLEPTVSPTGNPTASPTVSPSTSPSSSPTASPTPTPVCGEQPVDEETGVCIGSCLPAQEEQCQCSCLSNEDDSFVQACDSVSTFTQFPVGDQDCCTVSLTTRRCVDDACADLVCSEIGDFCCENAWSRTCRLAATLLCNCTAPSLQQQPLPDLFVADFDIGSTEVTQGEQVQLELTIGNQENGSVVFDGALSTQCFYLSSDGPGFFSPANGDTEINVFSINVGSLGNGDLTMFTVPVTIPFSVDPGVYTLHVYVDCDTTIGETNEQNNLFVLSQNFTVLQGTEPIDSVTHRWDWSSGDDEGWTPVCNDQLFNEVAWQHGDQSPGYENDTVWWCGVEYSGFAGGSGYGPNWFQVLSKFFDFGTEYTGTATLEYELQFDTEEFGDLLLVQVETEANGVQTLDAHSGDSNGFQQFSVGVPAPIGQLVSIIFLFDSDGFTDDLDNDNDAFNSLGAARLRSVRLTEDVNSTLLVDDDFSLGPQEWNAESDTFDNCFDVPRYRLERVPHCPPGVECDVTLNGRGESIETCNAWVAYDEQTNTLLPINDRFATYGIASPVLSVPEDAEQVLVRYDLFVDNFAFGEGETNIAYYEQVESPAFSTEFPVPPLSTNPSGFINLFNTQGWLSRTVDLTAAVQDRSSFRIYLFFDDWRLFRAQDFGWSSASSTGPYYDNVEVLVANSNQAFDLSTLNETWPTLCPLCPPANLTLGIETRAECTCRVPPTAAPTTSPTRSPSASPTTLPTAEPTNAPSTAPTIAPSVSPTRSPTAAPTIGCTPTIGCPLANPASLVQANCTENAHLGTVSFTCQNNQCTGTGINFLCYDGTAHDQQVTCETDDDCAACNGCTCVVDVLGLSLQEITICREPAPAPTTSPSTSPTNAPTTTPTNAPAAQPTSSTGICCRDESCFDTSPFNTQLFCEGTLDGIFVFTENAACATSFGFDQRCYDAAGLGACCTSSELVSTDCIETEEQFCTLSLQGTFLPSRRCPPPSVQATETFESGVVNLPIVPDGVDTAPTDSTIMVNVGDIMNPAQMNPRILDVDVRLTIEHDEVSDNIVVELEHEDVNVQLKQTQQNCPGFTTTDGYQDIHLDDSALEPLHDQCGLANLTSPPSYQPYEPLAQFNALLLNGAWTLRIGDLFLNEMQQGVLVEWSLVIEYIFESVSDVCASTCCHGTTGRCVGDRVRPSTCALSTGSTAGPLLPANRSCVDDFGPQQSCRAVCCMGDSCIEDTARGMCERLGGEFQEGVVSCAMATCQCSNTIGTYALQDTFTTRTVVDGVTTSFELQSGGSSQNAGGFPNLPNGGFFFPLNNQLVCDLQDNFYVVVGSPQQIYRIDASNGRVSYFAGGGNFTASSTPSFTDVDITGIVGMSIDRNDDVHVTVGNEVWRFDANTQTVSVRASTADNVQLWFMTFRTLDNAVVVSAPFQHVIYRSSGSTLDIVAGTLGVFGSSPGGVNGTAAFMNIPLGVAADEQGGIYISDFGNQVIRKLQIDNTLDIVAGTPGSPLDTGGTIGLGNANLFQPAGLVFGPDYNLYVGSFRTVKRIDTFSGRVDIVAGTPLSSEPNLGDGGSPLNATLNSALVPFVDKRMNVFMYMQDSRVIRKFGQCDVEPYGEPVFCSSPFSSQKLCPFFDVRTPAIFELRDSLRSGSDAACNALVPDSTTVSVDVYLLRWFADTGVIEVAFSVETEQCFNDGGCTAMPDTNRHPSFTVTGPASSLSSGGITMRSTGDVCLTPALLGTEEILLTTVNFQCTTGAMMVNCPLHLRTATAPQGILPGPDFESCGAGPSLGESREFILNPTSPPAQCLKGTDPKACCNVDECPSLDCPVNFAVPCRRHTGYCYQNECMFFPNETYAPGSQFGGNCDERFNPLCANSADGTRCFCDCSCITVDGNTGTLRNCVDNTPPEK